MPEEPIPTAASESGVTPPGPDPAEPAPTEQAASGPPDSASLGSSADAPAWQELALEELRHRRQQLLDEIHQLESRQEQINREIQSSVTGQADGMARRLKGFQDYLVGALQDLAVAAEQVDLVPQQLLVAPSALDAEQAAQASPPPPGPAVAAAGQFSADEGLIREQLAGFQGQPDFYAPAWKLRRSLDAEAAASLDNWFLDQGGRGAQPSGGSRGRNALVSAAAIAILGELYGDRFQTLVLASQPERLGEWRRGLQEALGLDREDFGPSSGIVLFERPDALIERADRLEERGELPLILVDAAEQVVDIPILQFPLWLAFAPGPGELMRDEEIY
ncbi:DUF3086 domain-containing protein [Cyanobium sp. LEGE 06113]|uniref:DUF3086 domain-containing protein n=1 Tax=Cyanobium sp. LEGE 06113 TaxID=1297573 RepID=UPI001883002B|nr:DUF3086 domain-containing protein [Cyanobium sp. LEGE 06113]MBE9152606.1 DUF3086 domain-containing protein [Cyanobium sp. LEGE 06113]MBE9153189.1 DUF3086 domain-containing protein [Cyanobium sp. LEGE 06113]